MELHTSNHNTLNLNFYCFQPIELSMSSLQELFNAKTSNLVVKNIGSNTYTSKWLKEFANLNNVFYSILNVDLENSVNIGTLEDELKASFKVNDKYYLDRFLDKDNTKYYLLFDYRLMYFILVYEISLNIPIDALDIYDNGYCKVKSDLYNTVRNLLVKETDNTPISIWANEIRQDVKKRILNILNDEFKLTIKESDINITNNSGNITNVVDMSGLGDDFSMYEQLSNKLLILNNNAERLTNNIKPIVIEGITDKEFEQFYNFNGRFHTVILYKSSDLYRYIPIQFHMQYMWFYLKEINVMLENEYNKLIVNADSIVKLEEHVYMIDNYISKVEILTMHNENFKLAIEVDNELIYQKIQQRWNIENKLNNSNKYISFFKDYLTRLYSKKTSKIEQRQNKILFIISIVQLITLISVWNDYITLFENSNVLYENYITNGLSHYLNIFSIFSTIIVPLGIVMTIYVLYFVVSKKNK